MTTEITHEKTPDTHSSIVGGSSAARILGCPGSVDLLAKIPDSVKNASSSYADEGTGLHEIMAYLVDNDVPLDSVMHDETVDRLWDQYKLHDDRMWDAVIPAYRSFLAYLDTLYGDDPDAELLIRVESRVEMPGIDDAFGTCDILIKAPKKTVVWDWKFGQGVPVLASYKRMVPQGHQGDRGEKEIEFGNDQLMFYARAAAETYPDYFGAVPSLKVGAEWPVELVICQPRILEEELSRYGTDTFDLEGFRLDLVDAVAEALSGKGQKAKGSYCRFAACKALCPLHLNGAEAAARIGEGLGKLQMLASQPAPAAGTEAIVHEDNRLEYADALAMMLELGEVLEPYIDEARKQAHTFMEAGGVVPGHKLVPKRAGWDGWLDDKKTDAFLGRAGLSVDDRRKPWEPITPAVARKKLKDGPEAEKQLKLLEKYVKPGVSSGTTLARNDDPRPEVKATSAMIGELANKIASIGGS